MGAHWKDIFREIKNTMGRFVSLLIITGLGATSVVGIQATSIDMRNVADKLYKERNLYDIQLKSATGFDDGDISALEGVTGVHTVMPTHIYDTFIYFENETLSARTYALPRTHGRAGTAGSDQPDQSNRLNEIELLDGRLPQNAAECAVESELLKYGEYQIGDTVTLGLDDMDDYFDVFENDTLTIVGVITSPLYISSERGNTSLGDGKLNFYLYLYHEAYKLDVYTDVYLLMDESRGMDNLTDDYYAAADEWKRIITVTGDERVQIKADELADAQRTIDDGWDEYHEGVNELDVKTSDARRELADAETELANAKAELEEAQRTLNGEVAAALQEIETKALEISEGQKEINDNRVLLENGQIEINETRELLNTNLSQLEAVSSRGVSPELDAQYGQIDAAVNQLNEKQAELDASRAALLLAERELDDGRLQINSARQTLEAERDNSQSKIDDGWAEYFKGMEEYEDGVRALENEEAAALLELADAKSELEEAQSKLDDAPMPEWFYFTRKDGVSYDSYYQDTLRLQKIGYVFPLMFFLVAILVSLTTMSRMVEEHRTQIGVYKALGHKPLKIITKYLVYAFSAGTVGGILGVVLGSNLFPRVIADAYGHLYDMPPVNTPIPLGISLIAVISAVGAVLFVTLITCVGSMKDTPALLMRPKSPPDGKRVLIEKISFIWSRLNFMSKVTARNIFRYKRRFVMTLIGVAGCSALLVTAFGLRDSVGGVGTLQYDKIVAYTSRAYLKEISDAEQRGGLDEILTGEYLYIREESVDAKNNGVGFSASLVIPETPEKLDDFIKLRARKDEESIPLTADGVLITEKLARVMGVAAGGNFEITMSDGKTYTVNVTGVVENYVQHFVYMTPEFYKTLFGAKPLFNGIFAITDDTSAFAESLLTNDNVRAVIDTRAVKESIDDSTDALRIVTVVLIILACALALVVLFNLTNINIAERIRELATIKVLGFYDSELALYIYRENGIVTVMGILLGIIAGIGLHGFVLTAAEIDLLMFPHIIDSASYIFSVVLSLAFATFVNLAMNYKLARIDMVESLKNVE